MNRCVPYWVNDCDTCTRCGLCKSPVCLTDEPEALCDECRAVTCWRCEHDCLEVA